ncbi:hypothetical protein VPHG_00069 [Vibrio phage 11895-B1]|uniref:hypothetical protein n=1 Tax=Vibrio phage 11895-B1 TaxID=754075 RepID=UPI0002C13C3A|nr:hypothetical protein VPHG_00069 [Vibrio phage 11895-B1]AGH32136.1 hypothetical protein VPHG_00069 [Vibrio phage 11895-B1]
MKQCKTRIVSAFPACGKSHLFWNSKDNLIADSDSSKFSWVEDEKGNKTRNPDFPSNYIKHIKSLIGEVDFIFVSSHEDVRKALNDNELFYTLVIPDVSLREEWIGRCFVRGNDYKFMAVLCKNWYEWLNPLKIHNGDYQVATCRLQHGEYLSDKIDWVENCTIPCN